MELLINVNNQPPEADTKTGICVVAWKSVVLVGIDKAGARSQLAVVGKRLACS